ncbi:NAD(P)H-hydrate dehydratase [Flavobacterium silvaticum]|uniref:ADP-dependent (S)-NAD(P)H-hydrate dehydratase n=1 Tax=Flavobacterium silvaticum TaxID=1852020 RepID=A0A972FJ08_9FLAO|nr:NAD(P)H-hydrate dehydratase [Flavobacterium silvaticum]NMH26919.1 NAD(P)H-hydrate dehydratase [Flavobacterium silvaticum]
MKQITRDLISTLYKPTKEDAHKGTKGHALLVGGSYGKMGSILLSSKAALRTGCGLVTAFVPECGVSILQTAFPEAMAIADDNQKAISSITFDFEPSAIGIGPGMGTEETTEEAFGEFLKSVKGPLVIDADALNILSGKREWLKRVPSTTILTPHPKEFDRLTKTHDTIEARQKSAVAFASEHKVIVVLKGAPTIITNGTETFENTTGNAALATAGSGDVLTGIITSLLAQGYQPLEAAQLGVYLHGLTADIAVSHTGTESFIASDIIGLLGKAFLRIKEYTGKPIGFRN